MTDAEWLAKCERAVVDAAVEWGHCFRSAACDRDHEARFESAMERLDEATADLVIARRFAVVVEEERVSLTRSWGPGSIPEWMVRARAERAMSRLKP